MLRALAFWGISLVTAVGWIAILPPAPLSQPLAFNHAKHAPMACVTCHRGAESEARAGIPQSDLCVRCHATAPRAAGAGALWPGIDAGQPIPWVLVTHVPTHVLFSHRRHVTLGRLDCVSCHGEMEMRTSPIGASPVRLDMQTCVSCHRREGASVDCAACHR